MTAHPPTRGGIRRSGAGGRLRATVLASVLALAALGPTPRAWGAGGAPADATVATADATADAVAVPAHHPRENTYMKRMWGVEVYWVRQTVAGYMLEFRYRVVDADKAVPLFNRQDKPVLIHAESGARLIVPTPATVGALRNSNMPVDGQIYWMFFANPGALVKPGDHVSIEIGDFRVDDLVVQ